MTIPTTTATLPILASLIPSPLSALHVVSGLMYGGGQRVVLDLLETLGAGGEVTPSLVTLGDPAGTPLAGRTSAVVAYNGRYNRPLVVLRTARNLRRILRRQRPVIVHTHGWDADLIGALAVIGTGCRHVSHLHVTAGWLSSAGIKDRLKTRVAGCLLGSRRGARIAVSQAVADLWMRSVGWSAAQVDVVPNGIDLAPLCALSRQYVDRSPLRIGVAARLAPMKGLEHLLAAIADLKRSGIDVELHIAGEGSLRESLEEKCRELDVAECVTFLGRVDDMPAFYRRIDLFVLPSVSMEGLPLVVLEAMAAGLPVVATDVGGTAEALRHGVDGLIVPPADAAALAAGVRTCHDADLRRRFGESGRQRAIAHFGRDVMAARVRDVYRRIARDPGETAECSPR